MLEETKQIGETFVDYFKNIFTSTTPSNFDQILQGIEPKITPSMNDDLIHDFTTYEVEQALNQMKPLTTSGTDGLPPIFFKSCWDIVGQDVILHL